jgi:Tol biopolymer transport system component
MADLEERIRSGLARLADPADPTGVLDRIVERRRRVRIVRRLRVGLLTVFVLAATAAGSYGLVTAFQPRHHAPILGAPSAAGMIAFARSSPQTTATGGGPYVARSEIYLMAPDGTGLIKLTDASSTGSIATQPAWSPDGTKIAFVLGDPQHLPAYAGDGDIYVMNADGTGMRQLTSGERDAHPSWSPDGTKIAFVRDQGHALYVMNADGTSVHEIYRPSICFVESPQWSPDGTEIAFRGGCDIGRIYLIHPDGSGPRALTPASSDSGTPAWSPDGKRIAFERGNPSSEAPSDDIWIMNADGTDPHPLTQCRLPVCLSETSPTWSPEGSEIAFERDLGSGNNFQLWVMSADGTNQRGLTAGPYWNTSPSWNPLPPQEPAIPLPTETPGMATSPAGSGPVAANGNLIVFAGISGPGYDIFTAGVGGAGLTDLTADDPADDATPAWSPDGRRIAFSSGRDGDWDLYVMNADGSDVTRLTNLPGAEGDPSWSPDGTRIAFYGVGEGGNQNIYVVNADGSGLQRLTGDPNAKDWYPDWSPDGTRILFERDLRDPEADADLWVMNLDGSNQVDITSTPGIREAEPTWSPDGTKIAFERSIDPVNLPTDIYVMNADGTGLTQLTDDPEADFAPSWSPDGSAIIFASNRNLVVGQIYIMSADGTNERILVRVPDNRACCPAPGWQPSPLPGG